MIKYREDLINRLTEGFHRYEEFRNSLISIYGSSNNGFGTHQSDIDLCLIDNSIQDVHKISSRVMSILSEIGMKNVDDSRLLARIPVIRFEDPVFNLQCDLCFNNFLPLRNTLLLKTYSYVDPRVRILGIILKKW